LQSAANHIEAGGEEALSIQRVLDYVVPAFERLLSRVKPVSSGLPQGDAVLAHEIQSLICLVFGALRRSQQGVLAPGHEQQELLRGPSPAATRSSQQRGSAGWLQSIPTRVTLSTGGIAPPLLHGCPPPPDAWADPKSLLRIIYRGTATSTSPKSRPITASKSGLHWAPTARLGASPQNGSWGDRKNKGVLPYQAVAGGAVVEEDGATGEMMSQTINVG
jgi:hypothetical protein